MSSLIIQSDTLTAIADAIRSKTGEEGSIATTDMATMIGSISGGSQGSATAAYGTYTFGENSQTSVTIDHNLGAIPKFVFFWLNTQSYSAESYGRVLGIFASNDSSNGSIAWCQYTTSTSATVTFLKRVNSIYLTFSDTQATIQSLICSTNVYFQKNTVYTWVVVA